MFPFLSDLLKYLFGVEGAVPIPTFGFFVAMAFVLAYFCFRSEFKRKEAEGVIKAVSLQKGSAGIPFLKYVESAVLGFILGFKVLYAFSHRPLFFEDPLGFMGSLQGNLLAGLLMSLLFTVFSYRYGGMEEKEYIHPNELMPKLIFWAAVWGFLGAKTFNYLENIPKYSSYTFGDFLKYSGLTFLGGLIFGAISYLYIGYKHKMRLIDLADIGSPGMLVAYGVGRIGCHLSGDGDWGIVNNVSKPFELLPDWLWASRFPHNILNQGEFIKGCTGDHCFALFQSVFPTSLYESIIILSCFLILWINRRKITRPGEMFFYYLLIVGLERFLIEFIKVNYKYRILALQLSEAQLVSLLFLVLSGICLMYIRKRQRHPSLNVL